VVAAALRIHFFLRLFPRCATVVPRQHELLPSFCFSLACISGMCAPYTRASKTVFAFFAVCLSVPCREVLLVGRVVLRVLIPFFFFAVALPRFRLLVMPTTVSVCCSVPAFTALFFDSRLSSLSFSLFFFCHFSGWRKSFLSLPVASATPCEVNVCFCHQRRQERRRTIQRKSSTKANKQKRQACVLR
jgi:hypothetical protein